MEESPKFSWWHWPSLQPAKMTQQRWSCLAWALTRLSTDKSPSPLRSRDLMSSSSNLGETWFQKHLHLTFYHNGKLYGFGLELDPNLQKALNWNTVDSSQYGLQSTCSCWSRLWTNSGFRFDLGYSFLLPNYLKIYSRPSNCLSSCLSIRKLCNQA